MKVNINLISDRDLLETIYDEMVSLKKVVEFFPQWIPLNIVSDDMKMSYRNMYRRVVESGLYEMDNHYKRVDGEVCVNKNIIHTLKRRRKQKSLKGGN